MMMHTFFAKDCMMRKYSINAYVISLFLLMSTTACRLSLYAAPPTATETMPPSTSTPAPTLMVSSATVELPSAVPATSTEPAVPAPTSISPSSVTQLPPGAFCSDPQSTALIDSFKTALQTSDGSLLSSLVSPVHGMDARYFRNGQVVNYDQLHAQFLFDSTYVVDWGAAPASGLEKKGSFHEVVLPALQDVFNKDHALACNQVQVGGATYKATWPYSGINFYSVYFAGTPNNGNLDWRT